MKIAFFSDIHGNHIAFAECIRHAREHGAERFVFLGDYLGEYPYPRKTLEKLYELEKTNNCLFLRGNKEDYWLNRKKDINCEWKNGNHTIAPMVSNYESLLEQDFSFFEELPISFTLCIDGMAPILCCHGSPEKNNVKLLPDNHTGDIVLLQKEQYIVCGHSHIQQIYTVGDKKVINGGAIGVPLAESGKFAQYVMLESDGSEWKHRFYDVPFDTERVIQEIYESGLYDIAPVWCRITIHLLRNGNIAHGDVLTEAMRINDGRSPWYNIPDEDWEQALALFGIE